MRASGIWSSRFGPVAFSLLFLALGTVSLAFLRSRTGPERPNVQIILSGCTAQWQNSVSELVCFPEPRRLLHLDVKGDPGTQLAIIADNDPPQRHQIEPDGSWLFALRLSDRARQVSLRDGRSGQVLTRITLTQPPLFPKLDFLNEIKRGADRKQQKDSLLSLGPKIERARPSLSPIERANLEFELGMWHEQTEGRDEAPGHFLQAMKEARDAGRSSVAAEAAVRYARHLFTRQGAQAAVDFLLDDAQSWQLAGFPRANATRLRLLTSYMLHMGRLRSARQYSDEMDRLIARYALGDQPELMLVVHNMQAEMFQQSGATELAEGIIGQASRDVLAMDGSQKPPHVKACQIQRFYIAHARVRMLGQEAGLPYKDPADLLRSAEAQGAPCTRVRDEIPSLLAIRARSLLGAIERRAAGPVAQADQLAEVDRLLARSRLQLPGTPTDELTVDWLTLEGRLALLRGQGEAARAAFAQLEEATLHRLDPYARWSALIGQADAARLQGEIEQADKAYQRAEDLLDSMLTDLEISARRQLFVAQFEAGTSRYLELLLRSPAQNRAALHLIRHAHARALATHSLQRSEQQQDPAQSGRLKQYAGLFATREEAKRALHDAPIADQEDAEKRLQDADRQLGALLEAIYQDAGKRPPSQPTYPDPAPGELLLACHPLPALGGSRPRWACLGADAQGVYAVRDLPPPVTMAQAETLVARFSEPLLRAKSLRILSYGPMRGIDWERVRLGDRPLSDRLDVGYGIDRALAQGTQAPSGRLALAVINPEQDLPGAERVRRPISHRLAEQGWTVSLYSGTIRRGRLGSGPLGWLAAWRRPKDTPATATLVREALGTANLLVYYGHAEAVGQGGWDNHLRLAEEGRLTARDIMTLPAVPEVALLIGCRTAVSDLGAPADELGLAQAFLLRGSKLVLATTRKVADASAEQLVTKLLLRERLGPGSASPHSWSAALSASLRELRQQQPSADWTAFRLYTQ